MRDFAVVDVETTGLDYVNDRITEIGVMRVNPKTFSAHRWLEAKVKPGIPVPPEVAELNGYDEQVWEREAVPWEKVMMEFDRIMTDAVWLGYNPRFDAAFISEEYERRRHRLPKMGDYHLVDVSSMAYPLKTGGFVESVSLRYVAAFFGLEKQEHRALSDCRLALQVYRRLEEWTIRQARAGCIPGTRRLMATPAD